MKFRGEQPARGRSIRQQINRLLGTAAVGAAVILVILILMLLSINRQYERALLCVNTAADFNQEFKNNIDLSMYHHVIQPRSESAAADLPTQELDQAEDVFRQLESATTLPDNRWRAQSMLTMCKNLRMYMEEIAQTPSYDQRMVLLDRNIRGETGLTRLIEQYMHNFVDDEVRELARLRSSLSRQCAILIGASVAGMALLLLFIVLSSAKISRSITAPIILLTKKTEQFGEKDYTDTPIETDISELQILDRSFSGMAGHITELMDQQIRNQRSLHRAQLELLQAQINPHFLYNTLDSIAILAENQREEDAVKMVNSLSTFFRVSLSGGEDVIPLRAELAQATSYLEIQQIRYSDILTYEIAVPEEIQEIPVPKLILQPLIENALYHGIKNRRGRGRIVITGEKNEDGIRLVVRDNGAGMSGETLNKLQSGLYQDNHSGLGLRNVHQRIRLYCGEPYGLFFESVPGEGSTVSILLPADGVALAQKEAYE